MENERNLYEIKFNEYYSNIIDLLKETTILTKEKKKIPLNEI